MFWFYLAMNINPITSVNFNSVYKSRNLKKTDNKQFNSSCASIPYKPINFGSKTSYGDLTVYEQHRYDPANGIEIQDTSIRLNTEEPKMLDMKDVCKIISLEDLDEEFYYDENDKLKIGKTFEALYTSTCVACKHAFSVMHLAYDKMCEIYRRKPLEYDYDKIYARIVDMDDKKVSMSFLEDLYNDAVSLKVYKHLDSEEFQRYNKAFDVFKKAIREIRHNNKQIEEIKNGAFDVPTIATMMDAKKSKYNTTVAEIDKENGLFKMHMSGYEESENSQEVTITFDDLYKYLDLIRGKGEYDGYLFVDDDIDIHRTDKDGKKALEIGDIDNSSYRAIHFMHRIISRYGNVEKNNGRVDFDNIKKVLDDIQHAFNEPSVPSNYMPRNYQNGFSAGIYLPINKRKTSIKRTNLIISNHDKSELIRAVFDKEGKIITVLPVEIAQVKNNFIPFAYYRYSEERQNRR